MRAKFRVRLWAVATASQAPVLHADLRPSVQAALLAARPAERLQGRHPRRRTPRRQQHTTAGTRSSQCFRLGHQLRPPGHLNEQERLQKLRPALRPWMPRKRRDVKPPSGEAEGKLDPPTRGNPPKKTQ